MPHPTMLLVPVTVPVLRLTKTSHPRSAVATVAAGPASHCAALSRQRPDSAALAEVYATCSSLCTCRRRTQTARRALAKMKDGCGFSRRAALIVDPRPSLRQSPPLSPTPASLLHSSPPSLTPTTPPTPHLAALPPPTSTSRPLPHSCCAPQAGSPPPVIACRGRIRKSRRRDDRLCHQCEGRPTGTPEAATPPLPSEEPHLRRAATRTPAPPLRDRAIRRCRHLCRATSHLPARAHPPPIPPPPLLAGSAPATRVNTSPPTPTQCANGRPSYADPPLTFRRDPTPTSSSDSPVRRQPEDEHRPQKPKIQGTYWLPTTTSSQPHQATPTLNTCGFQNSATILTCLRRLARIADEAAEDGPTWTAPGRRRVVGRGRSWRCDGDDVRVMGLVLSQDRPQVRGRDSTGR